MAIARFLVSSAGLAAAAAATSNALLFCPKHCHRNLRRALLGLLSMLALMVTAYSSSPQSSIRSRVEHMSDVAAMAGCSQPALGPISGHIVSSSTTSQSSLSLYLCIALLFPHHRTGALEDSTHHTVGVVLLDAHSPPSAPSQATSTTSPSRYSLYTIDSIVVPHYHQPLSWHRSRHGTAHVLGGA
ncbi:hypothetical protein V8C86DRAFT_109077 [Haematococcus lacustris]